MRSKFLKNLQWKKKLKRLGALGLCALLIAGNLTIPDVAKAASPDATYPALEAGESAIENALTYFQYFTSGDCTIGQHTVGAVAVGGTFNMTGSATFGDGAQTASYAHNIKRAVAPNLADGFQGVCNDVYYASTEMNADQMIGFTENADYMDIGGRFGDGTGTGIKAESNALADGATALTNVEERDGKKVIVVDFTNGDNYKIDYSVLEQVDYIDVKLNDIKDIISNKYVINITGMSTLDAQSTTFEMLGGTTAGGVDANPLQVGVMFNGQTVSAIKGIGIEANPSSAGQFFLGGMKLIFNFPDYEGTIQTKEFEGHIVAPNAKVIPGGGALQGGVIAREVYVAEPGNPQSAEAHYYPYNTPTPHYGCASVGSSGIVADTIVLEKVYQDAEGNEIPEEEWPSAENGPRFALYESDSNGTQGNVVKENIKTTFANGKYQVIISDTENIHISKYYLLVETSAASGYEVSTSKYLCRVDNKGDIYYKVDNNGETRSVPQCVNKKLAIQPGTIHVTVKTTDGTVVSSIIPVTLKQGNAEIETLNTENGSVTFSNVTPGEEYTVSIPQEISGYKKLEANVSPNMTVNAGDVINVEFELEKEVQQLPTTGRITVTVKKDDGAGAVAMKDVTVQVTGGPTSVDDKITGNEGTVEHNSLEFGTYTVTIPAQAGYTITSENPQSAELTAQQPDATKEFVLVKNGSLDVTVSCGENGVDGVSVTINKKGAADDSTAKTGTTTNGTVSFDDLEPGEYTVTISNVPGNYTVVGNTTSKDATVPVGNKGTSKFELEEQVTNSITVVVIDEQGNPVPNVAVVVQDPQSGQSAVLETGTDADGKASVSSVVPGNYTATITAPSGYVYAGASSQADYVDGDEQKEFEFVLAKTGTITIKVVDSATGEVVEKSAVAKGPRFGDNGIIGDIQNEMLNGTASIGKVTSGTYTYELTNVPDGYKLTDPNETTKEVTVNPYDSNERDKELIFYVTKCGTLEVTVKENDVNDTPVGDIEVTVTKKGENSPYVTGKTDPSTGKVTFEDVPVGDYVVSIPESNPDFETLEENEKEVKIEQGTNSVEFELTKEQPQVQTGTINVVVKDERGEAISDVSVRAHVLGNYNNVVWEGDATNQKGEASKSGIAQGDVVVAITVPEGYIALNNKKSESVKVDPADGDENVVFTLQKTAKLKVNIIDLKTGNPVSESATVNVEKVNAQNYYETYEGDYTVTNGVNDTRVKLTAGKYRVNMSYPPTGYVWVDEEGIVFTADPYTLETYEATFYVAQYSTVVVEVVKDNAPVKGQDVELWVKGADGTYKKQTSGSTNTDGKITFSQAPLGEYEVRVPVTEGNSTVYKSQSGELLTNETDNVTIDLSTQSAQDKGSIRVSLRDDNGTPGGLIGGEGITIKKENGELIGTYYSRWDNEIVIPDLEPGNYTVTVEDLNNYVRVDNELNMKAVTEGGETSFNFVYSKRCSLKVEVRDRTSNELIASPEISVTNGSDVNEETSDVSEYALTELKAGTYTATVEAPDGYVLDGDATQSVSFDPYTGGTHNEPHTLTFYVVKTGTITVDVKENDTNGDPISGISVILQEKQDDGSYTNVGEAKNTVNGTVTFENLPDGDYKVVIPENNTGYATLVNAENEKNVSITPNDKAPNAEFYLTPVGKLEIHVKDDNPDGSSYVDGVTVTVKDKDGHIVSIGSQTTAGVITLEDLTPGEYTVTIGDKVGYVAKNNKKEITQIVNAGDTATVYNFTLAKYAILKVNIYDITTGTPSLLNGEAKIEILRDNQSFHTKNLSYGAYTYEGVYAGEYKTTLTDLPAGYQVVSEGGNSVVTDIDPYDPNGPADGIYKVEFNVIKCGTVTVDVKENNANGDPVDGVKVKLYLDKGNHNYEIFGSEKTTGANGIVTFTDVPVRDYKVVISKENDGYEDLTDAECTKEGAFDQNLEAKESFYLTPEQTTPNTGSLKVTVVEKGTTNNVPGVTVKITNKDDSTEYYSLTSNDLNGGELQFNNIPTGTYIVEATPSVTGYKTLTGAQSKCEVEVKVTPQATHIFEYEPETADLIITVKDEKTNDPVPGAKVKITKKAPENGTSNQDESEVKETGNDGRIVMRGLRKGKYTTTVVSVPEGYNVTTDKEVVVDIDPANAPEAQVDYKVGQVGALKVTITEKGTTNGIYGVQVAITTNASGTENTVYTYTDANGQVNLAGQKVGTYKISIPTSIAGYKELDAAYVVQTKDVEANKTTEYAFEVEKLTTADPNKGDAEIIVKDEVTGNPVPGASVIVTAPDNTNRKYTTDGNGRITIPQQDPGDYKVEVIEVPEGYTVTQNKQTTITVVAGATVKAEIMVKPAEANSGAGGSEVEPPTVGSGQGEPDNNGGAVNTGGTSDNTGDVVNTGGATDSNNGGVITTGQTDGATNNKTTDSQSVSKQPKTGDETNPGIIWIILSVSACLAAASVIGLVYVKKKED